MSKKLLFSLGGLAVLAAATISSGVIAQGPGGPGRPGDGGMMMPPPPPAILMKAGTNGLFVLAGPSLIKYDATTLKQQAVLELAKPKDGQSSTDSQDRPPMPPMLSANMMLTSGADNTTLVLIVIGNKFYSIDAATLSIKAQATLPKLQMPELGGDNARPDGPGMPCMMARPEMELLGNTLYVQQAHQIVAIGITDGHIIAQTTLPKPPQPKN